MTSLDLDEGGWTTVTAEDKNWQAPKHSWRQDKKTSLADWTIVLDLIGGGTKSYDVHQILLGTGERSSIGPHAMESERSLPCHQVICLVLEDLQQNYHKC
eukprot:3338647-Rhodomonas_salina.2